MRQERTARVTFALVLALVSLALPLTASAEEPTAPDADVEQLGTPGKKSYWAFVDRSVPARKEPSKSGKTVTRLRTKTEDATNELVQVLARTRDSAGRYWLNVRLPIRPNNSTGWVPRDALGTLHINNKWVFINRAKFRATVKRDGKAVFTTRVGVGRKQWPTPAGSFYIRDKLRGFKGTTAYGPIALGTSAKSVLTDWPGGGTVGIHGTNEPNLIPGRISHGCIRMKNKSVVRFDRIVPVGTPVTIK